MRKSVIGWQMLNSKILHASLVVLDGKGILITGKSGCGKSDLAFRLIEEKKAILVADDVVRVFQKNGILYGECSEKLAGLLEIRGVGIAKYNYLKSSAIRLVVNLKNDVSEIERLPIDKQNVILGVEIPAIDLYAKECSAPNKICVKLRNSFISV